MRNIIALYCDQKTTETIVETVNSLLQGIKCPDEVVITMKEGVKTPQSLKKKDRVHIQRLDKDYGNLSALVGIIERYPEHDNVRIAYADSRTIYPNHMLMVFDESIEQIENGIKKQSPNTEGIVCGACGIAMVENKKRNIEKELEELTGNSDIKYEKKTLLGYPNQSISVDFLEPRGFLYFNRSILSDKDFPSYLDSIENLTDLVSDIVLSNYFAKKGYIRACIFNHIINNQLLQKMGCFKKIRDDEYKKMDSYEKTILSLRDSECFVVYP